MSEKIHAADAIRASIRQFKALSEFADALEKVGSIEQAEKEANAATNTARAEADKAKEQANKANQVLAQLQETTRLKLIENEQLEKDWTEKAQAEVLELKTNAKEKANRAVQEAQTKADSLIAGAQSKLIELNAQVSDTRTTLKQLEAEVIAAETELKLVTDKIANAQAKIARLLGN